MLVVYVCIFGGVRGVIVNITACFHPPELERQFD